MKNNQNTIKVSTSKLRRADMGLCKEFDLVSVDVLKDTDTAIKEIITYRHKKTRVLYQVTWGALKKFGRYGGKKTITLTRKNKK